MADVVPATLTDALVAGLRAAFAAARRALPDETFYGYAVYTTREFLYIDALVMGEQGLRRAALGYAPDHVGEAMDDLRWSAGDCPYIGQFEEQLQDVQALLSTAWEGLHDDAGPSWAPQAKRCCDTALKQLDAEGFFGTGEARDRVVVNVLYGDQSDRGRFENAQSLNPPGALARLASELRLAREVGTFTTLGPRAYQVRGLAASGDVLAAMGWVWRGDTLILSQGSDAWHVAVTDREVLLAGHRVLTRLSLDASAPRVEERHEGRMVAVAASRDGRWVFTSDIEGCEVPATERATVRWRRAIPARALALSASEGTLVAAVGSEVQLLDAATGATAGLLQGLGEGVRTVACGPGGMVAAGTNALDSPNRITLWSGDQFAHGCTIPPPLPESAKGPRYQPTGCTALAFSPDGTRLASAHTSGEAHVWDVATGTRLTTVRGRHESLSGVAWRDDAHLAIAGRDVDVGPAVYVFDVSGPT